MKRKGVVRDLLTQLPVLRHLLRRRVIHAFARAFALASCVGALAACDESLLDVTPSPSGGSQLVAVTPTQLLAEIGFPLDTPIRVRVFDANGNPAQSATVHYSVLVGAGIFSADSTITNDQGFTQVTFRPLSAGTVIIEARVDQPTGPENVRFTIQVFNDRRIATRFEKVSGDNQGGLTGTVLGSPLVVRLLNADGFAVAGIPVTFAVGIARGDSTAVAASRSGPFVGQVTVVSDSGGFARGFARLGTEAGPYTFTASAVVEVSGSSQTQTLTFNAQAQASGRVTRLVVVSGDNQSAVIDTLHTRDDTLNFRGRDPQPMVLQALDRFGTPVPGASISWFVSDGGGRLLFASTTTDNNGVTSNQLFDVTEGRNAVVAFTPGAAPVEFVVNAVLYEPPAEESGGG